jgi:hypothetical protein
MKPATAALLAELARRETRLRQLERAAPSSAAEMESRLETLLAHLKSLEGQVRELMVEMAGHEEAREAVIFQLRGEVEARKGDGECSKPE